MENNKKELQRMEEQKVEAAGEQWRDEDTHPSENNVYNLAGDFEADEYKAKRGSRSIERLPNETDQEGMYVADEDDGDDIKTMPPPRKYPKPQQTGCEPIV